jgi:hypothetical protein
MSRFQKPNYINFRYRYETKSLLKGNKGVYAIRLTAFSISNYFEKVFNIVLKYLDGESKKYVFPNYFLCNILGNCEGDFVPILSVDSTPWHYLCESLDLI